MIIVLHKHLEKQFKKLPQRDKNIVTERLSLFTQHPYHPLLRNHALKGKYTGYRSIDIRPDLRAIYYGDETATVVFVMLGSHAELY